MALPRDFIERLRSDLDEERRRLRALESGTLRLRQGKPGQDLEDITQDEIAHCKRVITVYEEIITRGYTG